MEREGREKRKRDEAETLVVQEEECSEEEKMEKFFELMRRLRESRERLRSRDAAGDSSKKAKRAQPRAPAWVPRFEWEDFAAVRGSEEVAEVTSSRGAARKEKTEQDEKK